MHHSSSVTFFPLAFFPPVDRVWFSYLVQRCVACIVPTFINCLFISLQFSTDPKCSHDPQCSHIRDLSNPPNLDPNHQVTCVPAWMSCHVMCQTGWTRVRSGTKSIGDQSVLPLHTCYTRSPGFSDSGQLSSTCPTGLIFRPGDPWDTYTDKDRDHMPGPRPSPQAS